MKTQQLFEYVSQQLKQGVDREQIKQSLITSGWQDAEIEAAFQAVAQAIEQESVKPPKKRWKLFALIAGGLILVSIMVVLFLPNILGVFLRDIPPINDSDLRVSKVSVPENENAYFILRKAESAIARTDLQARAILDGFAELRWDQQAVDELLSKNEQVFEYFLQAMRMPKYQNPAFADPANANPDIGIVPWSRIGSLVAVKALSLAKQGKDDEAMDMALNAIRIGQRIQESQITFIEYWQASWVKKSGLEMIQRAIPFLDLTSAQLKQYIRYLDRFYENEQDLIAVIRYDYSAFSMVIDGLARGEETAFHYVFGPDEEMNGQNRQSDVRKFTVDYFFQPNRTKLLLAESSRSAIWKVYQPCWALQRVEANYVAEDTALSPLTKNKLGKFLYARVAPEIFFIGAIERKCKEDLVIGVTQAMLAIKAFENDTGSLPVSLDELVPNYIQAVPEDPFDGKAIKYSAEKRILYSIGPDLKDEGGSVGDIWHRMPDPTFKISF